MRRVVGTFGGRPLSARPSAALRPWSAPELRRSLAPFSAKPLVGSPTKDEHDYLLNHRVYTTEDVHKVGPTHVPPKTLGDRAALLVLRLIRAAFDTATGYGHGMTTDKYLTRIIVLETVAGVPPMVGAMVRHTRSLRSMKRDGGWIHTLLEEAENERMHLLTFLSLRPRPSWMLRAIVLLGQGVVFNAYLAAYLLSPRVCHRFIGFLEEEAVNTYTGCIAAIDAGTLAEWRTLPAPPIAVGYWRLPDGATMRDLLLAVRADEATHRDVNHGLADVAQDAMNPFAEAPAHPPPPPPPPPPV